MKINFQRLLLSFRWALQGLRSAWSSEQNLRIEALALILVSILGIALRIERMEWLALLISSSLVIFAELVNTAIERVTDLSSNKEITALAMQAKDIGAAAVLVAAINSIGVGAIIFLPKIISLLT